jgi:5-methylcytosine-specific restriction enzyme subunit McrC
MEINSKLIQLKEHEKLSEPDIKLIESLNIQLTETEIYQAPEYLGIKPNYEASYFIGADWLSDELSVAVTPKMPNINYIKMFLCALEFDLPTDYFSRIYAIDFDKKEIACEGFKDQITPLLIIHFLSIIKRLVKRGLKKDYIIREQNLSSKVKGHILISKNIQKNVIPQRLDRAYCRFQEYTLDHPENRLLKKALLFTERYFSQSPELNNGNRLRTELNTTLAHFETVSDQIEISSQIRNITNNKLYREHTEAVKIAKQILRRFSYSIHEVNRSKAKVPAFWIDMSRLYEVYVYSLLHKAYGNEIEFQVPGYRKTAVDFIKRDQRVIIDTKYKPHYSNSIRGIVDDVRQISGYARDEKILKRLLGDRYDEDFVPRCLIIYPEKDIRLGNSEDEEEDKEIIIFDENDILKEAVPIKAYRKFYKVSVLLPTI